VAAIEEFLAEARRREASDLHLSAGAVPYVRVEGEIVRLPRGELEEREAEELAAQCAKLGRVEPGLDVDFCFEAAELGRFRVNLHRQARGAGLAIKCIPLRVLPLAELGLPPSLEETTWYRTGMVLATGPAGCGKTCTLAALLQQVNRSRRDHVVTIEDPIEFVFPSEGCNVTQRQVGPHTRSFSRALRAALREDPDVILVSELRDVETIRTAVVAAETGHLVLGTLHTRDAAATVSRLIDVFPAAEQDQIRTMVAASLRTVISQRLLPRLGGGRRVPAYEILHVTPAVAHLIRDGRAHQIPSQLQTGRRQGMIDLDARLEEMVAQGLIAMETARHHAKNRKRFGDEGEGPPR
jgi:twitching motility protein PilT